MELKVRSIVDELVKESSCVAGMSVPGLILTLVQTYWLGLTSPSPIPMDFLGNVRLSLILCLALILT